MSSDTPFSLEQFSVAARSVVTQAQKFADDRKCRFFDPAHLLVILLDTPEVLQVFKELGINTVSFISHLHTYLAPLSTGEGTSTLSPSTATLLNRARTNAGACPVTSFDILYACTQETKGIVGNLMQQFEITPQRIVGYLNKGKDHDLNSSPYFTNLSLLAKKNKLDVVIGRDTEVRRLIQILGRRSKHNPLLIGEPGVGKRTIVMSLVERIATGNIPKSLLNVSVLQLNTANLLAGAKTRVDVEVRLREALKTIGGYNILLYVRSLEALQVPGLNLNLVDLFGLLWEVTGLRVIAACGCDTFKKLGEKDNQLLQEFTCLNVEPCTPECAVEILRGVASRYEKHHSLKIGEDAINSAVKLAKRYIKDRFLPESAIDLIDESASHAMMEVNGTPIQLDKLTSRLASVKAQLMGLMGNKDANSLKVSVMLEDEARELTYQINAISSSDQSGEQEEQDESVLSEAHIAAVLGDWTGIPVAKLGESETNKLARMEECLSQRVIGQAEALGALAKAVRRNAASLRDKNKPIGSFLFLGSSGTGKTEVAKALSEFLFDDENAMLRLDMSEFMLAHNAARLVGAPSGFQGSEAGGQITEFVRKHPYSTILFDEVEKAHPDVFNLLLQILDDGRLTDGVGKIADFSNTVIIMTSNIGSQKLLDADKQMFASPEGRSSLQDMLHQELKASFRPEFLNRLNQIVMFEPLGKTHLAAILEIQLRNIQKMVKDKEITIEVEPRLKQKLIDVGYEPAYGARPLKRAIMSYIQDPLAEALVKPTYRSGSTLRFGLDSHDNVLIEEMTI